MSGNIAIPAIHNVREMGNVTLDGVNWTTVNTFLQSGILEEIFIYVPTLSAAATVTLGLFDPVFVADGNERWNSGAKAEGSVHAITGIARMLVHDGLLRIKADAAAVEVVSYILYWKA